MDGWVEGMVTKNLSSSMCPLFSVALCSFSKQQTNSLLCCLLQAGS